VPELAYDPAAARALLREARGEQPLELELVHRSAASITAVAALLKEQLAAVGIELRLVTPPWPQLVADWKAGGRIPFLLAGWYFENGDAMSFFRDCLATRDAARGQGAFNPGYSNAELDALVDEGAPLLQRLSRIERYEKLTRLALDEVPLVPLYHRASLYAVSKRVRWEPRLDGKLLAAEMTLVEPTP
jgi:peptide/nickel transport system substrate-binding protein